MRGADGGRRGRRAFSTSGSLLVVFAGLLLATGTFYTATANTAERMAEATDTQQERFDAVQQSQVTVTDATWNTTDANLTVRAQNTGETELDAERVDVLVDGEYVAVTEFERVEIDNRSTDVWLPGERLVLEDADTVEGRTATPPRRVKLVAGPGVADVLAVREVSA